MTNFVIVFTCVFLIRTTVSYSITLQNKNQTTCLTNFASPVFIDPPAKTSKNLENEIGTESWENDDWDFQKSHYSLIVDKRWEDLEITYTKFQKFNSCDVISFSAYQTNKIKIYLSQNGSDESKEIIANSKSTNPWIHYSAVLEDSKIFVYENGRLANVTTTDLNVDQIVVRTAKKTFWRKHESLFRTSNHTSKKPSILEISPTGRTCVFLYTSQCEKCLFYIFIFGKTQKELNINSTGNGQNMLLGWQQLKIDVDPKNTTEFVIFRGKEDNDDNGYWAIDFKLCPKINRDMGIRTFSTGLTSKEHKCAVLNTTENEKIAENVTFCSKPGKLGRNCNMTCEEVMGPDYKFCKNYKICIGEECLCAWGYTGSSCEKKCQNGTWGLSCQNFCIDKGCENCDSMTGQCNHEILIKSALTLTLVVTIPLIIFCLVVIIILLVTIYK